MEDQTDANSTGNGNQSKNGNGNSTTILVTSVMSDTYSMDYGKKGKAIIFNHHKFDGNLSAREGTNVDAANLKNTLTKLGFSVEVHQDPNYGDVYDIIRKAAKEDYSQDSCLVVAVMSHGEQGYIYAKDHKYKPETLWTPFSGDKCKTLAGKPKLFFIQACRGEDVDDGVKVTSRTFIQKDSSAATSYTIPAMADILVMYSTYDGHYSWRNPVSGSWFIQSLCLELEEHAAKKDLMTILTFVNRRMAIGYESVVPRHKEMHQKKQIGTIVSTLTRKLYFYQKTL